MARGDTGVQPGSTAMLVLAVLKDQELYGYRIIEELAARSQNVFQLKEGTLYPLLHAMEKEKLLKGREAPAPNGRTRRYYRITKEGLRVLEEKEAAWHTYADAVGRVLRGGACCAGT